MVFSLDSSLVLAAVVGVWLLWVAPIVLRRTRPATAGSTPQMPRARTDVPVENMMTSNAPHDDAAATGDDALPPARTTPDADGAPARSVAPRTMTVTPYRGRMAVAAVGLVALVATLVTFALALFGAVSLLLPLACIAVVALAVAALRLLAVRGRQARVNRAFAHAMAPVREMAPERSAVVLPAPAAPRRPTTLFDAQETAARPLSAMELRTAALAVAHGSSVVDVRAAASSTTVDAALPPAGTTAWAPVEVPRPTYVDAAKAERQAPAPLDLPEAPKPSTKTPIKASEAAARVAEAAEDAEAAAVSAPMTGRINLDDVLQRRRA
ncbi:hypothetical protein CVO76_08340 [Arthrobacter agilis]|uniref:Uncharacterized protein n=2 Tax=Arthrobacter agilis TaxID=37921 RepID=A0A2L0UEJ9_9MICC|nr:hypothetical protein CVO76_08340 [Arthrobacter agilis]